MEIPDDPTTEPPSDGSGFFVIAIFELSLIAVAMLIGWWFEFDPRHDMRFGNGNVTEGLSFQRKLLFGLVATVPLFAALAAIELLSWSPTREIRRFMNQNVVPWITPLAIWQLILLGVTAGICEELLFRGAVQIAAMRWLSVAGAIGLAAAIFGAAHYVTWWYAIVATAAGSYLGWLFFATDSLIPPTVAHAIYDVIALIYLARFPRRD